MATIDRHKLERTLDFVQGFIRPVTIVYEETAAREAAVVGAEGMRQILQPVFVRVDKRNNLINVIVSNPGGTTDVLRTESACRMATTYLDRE